MFPIFPVYAEIPIITGHDEINSIMIAIDDAENIVILQSNEGISEHYESQIKMYNSGGFSLRNIESGILVFAHPINEKQYKIVVLTSNQVFRFTGITEILSDVVAKSKQLESDTEPTEQKELNNAVGSDIAKYDIPIISRDDDRKDFSLAIKADRISSIRLGDSYDLSGYVYNVKNQEKLDDAQIHVEISRDDYVLRDTKYTTDVGGSFRILLEDISYPLFYPEFCYDVKITTTYQNHTNVWTDDFLILYPLGINVWEPDMSWLDLTRWNYLPSEFRVEPRTSIYEDSKCN